MTDAELRHALLHFRSREPDPRLRPDPYHLRQVADDLRSAFVEGLAPDFIGRLRQTFVDGLARLDALPRSEAFWEGTNGRPTLEKLAAFARYVLARQPGDRGALWVLVALALLRCANHFGLSCWQRLRALGGLDLSWPVNAAFHVFAHSGHDTTLRLVEFLKEADAGVAVPGALEWFRHGRDRSAAQWARAILDRCPVPRAPELLAQHPDVRPLALAVGARRLDELPVLADALEEAGCPEPLVSHCRRAHDRLRGCWVADWLLGRE